MYRWSLTRRSGIMLSFQSRVFSWRVVMVGANMCWVGLIVLLSVPLDGGHVAGQGVAPAWRDMGVPWPSHFRPLCIDARQPYIFYINEDGMGTIAYNWQSGQKTIVNA